MAPIIVVSNQNILRSYGIYFAEPYVVVKNLKDPNNSNLLHRIFTLFQKYLSALTLAKSSRQYLLDEKVPFGDCRYKPAIAERLNYDIVKMDLETLLKKGGLVNKPVEIELTWEKPILPIGATIDSLPELEFDHDKIFKYL